MRDVQILVCGVVLDEWSGNEKPMTYRLVEVHEHLYLQHRLNSSNSESFQTVLSEDQNQVLKDRLRQLSRIRMAAKR